MLKTRHLLAKALLIAVFVLPIAAALVPHAQQANAANECPANVTNVVTWTYSGGNCTGVFVASSTWSVPAGTTSFDYLVVGGGGGGATGSNANGGNGGTVTSGTGRSITGGSSVTVTVGAGGAASGATGGTSSLVWTANSITAAGGAGGAHAGVGADGTSNSLATGSAVIYGSSGGQGNNGSGVRAGGSGAGAGAQGIVGNCSGGIAGTANRGGGGGGGATCDYGGFYGGTIAGAGGSGIVVVKYVAFAVSSFSSSQTSPTNSASFTYTLAFNGNVDATTVSAADFSNTGTASCTFSVSPTTGATTTFTVTVSGCTDGTVVPRLAINSVTSSGGVTGPGSAADGNSVTVDRTAPNAPGTPDLTTATDTGASSSDNITNSTSPAFSVTGGTTGDTATISATNGTTTKTCTYVIGSGTSCALSGVTDGTWTVTGTLTDPAGNVSPASTAQSMTVDTTAPAASTPDLLPVSDTGSSTTDNVTNDTTPTVSGSGGSAGDTVTVSAVNGGTTKTCSYDPGIASSCDLPALTAGTWTVSSTVTDPAGNTSAAGTSFAMTVDTTAPTTPSSAPDLLTASDSGTSSTDNKTNDNTPAVSGSGGTTGDTVTVSATDGTTTKTCSYVVGSGTSCDLPVLGDGAWSVTSTVTDPAGNTSASSPSLSMTIDTTVGTAGIPDLVSSSDTGTSSTDNVTNDTTPTFSATGGSSGDTVTISATDGTTTKTCSYVVGSGTSCDLPTMTAGSWSVTSTISDPSGNTSAPSSPLSMTLDTTAPGSPSAPDLAAASDTGTSSTDNVTNDTTPTMSVSGGSAGDTATISATDGTTTKTCSYVIGSATSCDLPTMTAGTWTVTGTLTDAAGNTSSAGPSLSMTLDTTAPSTPPSAPDLVTASDTGTSSTDNKTNDNTPAISGAGGTSGDTVTISATNGSSTLTCSYVIGSATSCDLPTLSDGTWTVTSTLTDPAGNTSAVSAGLTVTVDTVAGTAGTPDLAAASDTGTTSTDNITNDTTPTVSATGGTTGDTITISATDGSTTKTCTYVVGTGTSCDLPTLSPGVWSITATVSDPSGNVSPASSPLSVTVDTVAPVAPSAPDLVATSDTGTSNTDNVTNDTTPTMSVTGGSVGDTVTISATDGTTTKTCTYVIGSAASCDLPTMTAGTWTVTGTLTDPAGNVSAAGSSLSMTLDTTSPVAPGTTDLATASDVGISSTDNLTSDATPTVSATGGSNGDTMTLSATNGSTSVSCTYVIGSATNCDLPAMTDGTWTVAATLMDPAGNTSTSGAALTLTVDTTAPVSALPDLATSSDSGRLNNDDNTSDTTPTLSAAGGSTGDTVTMSASNGLTTVTCTYTVGVASNCTLAALADGTWSVTATITDTAGNTSAPSPALSMVIDTVVPPAPLPDLTVDSDLGISDTDNLTADNTPAMAISNSTAGDTVTISATLNGTTVTCTYVVGPATSCDLPTLADGTWTVTAAVTDAAGNVSVGSGSLQLRIDTTPANPPTGTPDLVDASDTGTSTTDNLTADNTPTIAIPDGPAGEIMNVVATNGTVTRTCRYVIGQATSCTLPKLTDGKWTVYGTITNSMGSVSTPGPSMTITVDTTVEPLTVPVLTLGSDTGKSATDNLTQDRTPTVSATGGRTGDTMTITATNGADTVSCSYTVGSASSCTLSKLGLGTWVLTATVTDAAGNTQSAATGQSIVIGPDPVITTTTVAGVINASAAETTTTTSAVPVTVAPATTLPGKPTGGAAHRRNGNGKGKPVPPVRDLPIGLIASALTLAAIKQRRKDDDAQRLSGDDRSGSGVAELSAGSGSGGVDLRADRYRAPLWDALDRVLLRLAPRACRVSPAVGRSVDDGSYLRALMGVFWLMLPAAGAVAGVWAALDTASTVMMPALWLVGALLLVGTLDALAGMVATVAYGITVLVNGGFDGADAVRGYLGIAVMMFVVGLVASATRPYRRESVGEFRWHRSVDAVLIPLFGAWAASSMYQAMPNLSAWMTESSTHTGFIEWFVLGVLVLRYLLENAARVLVANRLVEIENETLPDAPRAQKAVSRVIRGTVFAFVAVVFIGNNWALWLGTAMFVVPKFVDLTVDRFPSFPAPYRWIPRNLTRTVLMFFVMLWWGTVVSNRFDGPDAIQWAFVLMSVPGLVLGAVDWFVRDGDEWESTPASKVLGVVVLVVGFASVRGWIL